MRIYDLPCLDGRRSFYGKAQIIEQDNGETVLRSYQTEVCKITAAGAFVRLWGGWSVTRGRHINSFLSFMGIPGGGKAWFLSQPMEAKEKRPGPDMTPAESYRAMMARRMGKAV